MVVDMKKIMLAGLGVVATTYDKSNKIINEMVKKGRITVNEGCELSKELSRKFTCENSNGEKNKCECEKNDKEVTKDDIENIFLSYENAYKKEIQELRDRINVLELKLNNKE